MRVLVLVAIALLAGCGQSGDLYLPPKQQPPAETAPVETPPPVEGTQEPQEKKEKQ